MAMAFVGRLRRFLRRQRLSVRGRIMATAFVGRLLQLLRRQCLSVRGHLMATAFVGRLLQCYRPQCVPHLAKLLGSLVNCSLCARGGRLSTLFLGECRTPAAVLLVAQACKGGLTLLAPRSLVDKPDVEGAAAKPQEDGSGCRHLSCKSSALGHEVTSSLLVEKELMTCSLLVE
jgi:hypothetical protein